LVRVGAQKVPEVALVFWVVKLLSTAMGESTSDYLVFHVNPYVAVIAGTVGLVVALAIQLRAPRYDAARYWFAVVMVAVFGTMAADVAHVVLKVPYVLSAGTLGLAVVALFGIWYRTEHTLSIHSIDTLRRELFYWATVIAAFALGTALGDLTASTFGLGYGPSVALFVIAFVVPGIAWRWLHLDAVVAFWWAYVVTRPLGASVADWLGKSSLGGLGIGDGPVAIVLTLAIIAIVAWLARTRLDQPRAADANAG
jgi:uncharacterized membrane-anchored protein